MKITGIETYILVVPELKEDATSSSQDDFIVIVHTDEGISGTGECDVGPWLARAAIEAPGSHSMAMSIRDMLIGMDPFDTGVIWDKMYTYTKMSGRRGAVICAMSAVDNALWDIKGKALGLPVYKLLGGAHRENIVPYASLQPHASNTQEYGEKLVEWTLKTQKMGFTAAKLSLTLGGPYSHTGLRCPDEEITEILKSCRVAVGNEFTLMVDVQYMWSDAKGALNTLKQWEDMDLYFLETPLNIDDLDGYALLASEAPMRIAAGEWQTTRFEFLELMDKGKLDVVQPDVGRVGGLTEAMRVCHLAQDRGRLVIPHCWKTGIGIVTSAHMAAAIPNCPFIEFLPSELCDSALREELVEEPLKMVNGHLELPQKPGLGIELNMDTVKRYTVNDQR